MHYGPSIADITHPRVVREAAFTPPPTSSIPLSLAAVHLYCPILFPGPSVRVFKDLSNCSVPTSPSFSGDRAGDSSLTALNPKPPAFLSFAPTAISPHGLFKLIKRGFAPDRQKIFILLVRRLCGDTVRGFLDCRDSVGARRTPCLSNRYETGSGMLRSRC